MRAVIALAACRALTEQLSLDIQTVLASLKTLSSLEAQLNWDKFVFDKASIMLVIVSGLPGSGKSYFAIRLAERLGAEYISSDQTRKAMDAMGRYRFEDKLTVYEEMAKKTGEGLRQGKVVVVDATFYRHEMRDIFSTLCKLLHKPFFYFEIQADRNLIEERLSQPRVNSEANFAVYQQLVREYENPMEERKVLQSTNSNIEAMLTEAIAYLGKSQ